LTLQSTFGETRRSLPSYARGASFSALTAKRSRDRKAVSCEVRAAESENSAGCGCLSNPTAPPGRRPPVMASRARVAIAGKGWRYLVRLSTKRNTRYPTKLIWRKHSSWTYDQSSIGSRSETNSDTRARKLHTGLSLQNSAEHPIQGMDWPSCKGGTAQPRDRAWKRERGATFRIAASFELSLRKPLSMGSFSYSGNASKVKPTSVPR